MPRGFLIFALCLPLAILLGFMLSDPLMERNMMVIAAALFMLMIPLAINVHHRGLIWFANAFVSVFFLPGKPQMWMVLAAMSFLISMLSRPLSRNKPKPVWDPMVFYSLLFMGLVVVLTAKNAGGVGLKILGSGTYGGRKYIYIIAAIVGFFALTLHALPRKFAKRDASIFILAPMTAAVGNLAYTLGPGFYFLFLLFPVEMAMGQAAADFGLAGETLKRVAGLGPFGIALAMFSFMRWGLRGMMDLQKPWRVTIFLLGVFISLFSGFRSSLAICFLIGGVQFFAEGLYRTRYALVLGAITVFFLGFLMFFADTLPLSAQRAISFLPGVTVDSAASANARQSIEWRLQMWQVVAKEIPKYLWIGKGYAIDPTDLYLAEESLRRGFINDYDFFVSAGDYHNGPLSIIIPFGIFGVLGFLWFLIASMRALWKNMRYGDLELKNINIFLFSFFLGRIMFFFVIFGGIEADLWLFTATIGLSLTLNHGVREAPKNRRLQHQPARAARDREAEPALI